MHIAILGDPIDTQYAGIHHYTKNLIENLLKIDDKNTYTIIHPKPNKWLTDLINANRQNTRLSTPVFSQIFPRISEIIIPRSKFPGGESIRRFFKIPKIINKISPDIVIEPCHIGPFRLKKGIKRVLIVHDITPILFPHFHTFRGRFIHKLFFKKSIENADTIITPSQTTKDDILKKYHPKAKISVIHLGVNPIIITQLPKLSPDNSKQSFQNNTLKNTNNNLSQKIQNLKPYILYLGTIEPRKNLEILLETFIELKTMNQIPHKLVLSGQIGWKSKLLLKKINTYNNQRIRESSQNISTQAKTGFSISPNSSQIITTNHVTEEEKNILLKNADIFIYPSFYEGFGLPPLEAMNAGIPVICSKGGSLKEIYKNTALFFNPNDKETLKKHILSLIENKIENKNDIPLHTLSSQQNTSLCKTSSQSFRATLIKNGLSFAKSHTWKKTVEETLKAISY